MNLLLFCSLWTNGGDLTGALADCASERFDGVEGPVPAAANERDLLRDSGVPFIAEVATGGGYVPAPHLSPHEHLEDFRRQVSEALVFAPLQVTALAGSDAWPLAQAVDFFGGAAEAAAALGVPVSFETHRSRPTFSPWATREILRQLPSMMLTCDFSHWCCVCERLVLEEEPALLALCAERAQHIHARAGYDQGPQVPHPAAPEYAAALEAHERWWRAIWAAQERSGRRVSTMTPEFGPDGYLQALPFTATPVADLAEINAWMAARQRELFAQYFAAAA